MKEDLDKVNNNRFSLYTKINKFTIYSRKYIINLIPKVHTDIKIHYTDELYNLSKNMFYSTYNKGNIRMKYLIELQVNISLLNMLLNILKSDKIIKNHNIDVAISSLSDIKNIIYGWKFNEEKTK